MTSIIFENVIDNIFDSTNNINSFFENYDYKNKNSIVKKDPIGFKLFVEYDFDNKHNHNMFWCRQWGYSGKGSCDEFNDIIDKVGCKKMIIAHCPQFLSENTPKMINFDCIDKEVSEKIKTEVYRIARVDIGMSRSFEYNILDKEFNKFLSYNYHRKMAVLKLQYDEKISNYYFNYNSIISKKISCLQYVLLKFGKTKEELENKNIKSDWVGFDLVNKIYMDNKNSVENMEFKNNFKKCSANNEEIEAMLCLLYPFYYSDCTDLSSITRFNEINNFF